MKGKKRSMGKKGFVNAILAIVIGMILLIGVSIPITQEVIETANLSGLSATVIGFVPVFLAIAGLVLATSVIGARN